jgi:putative spermidine/putrescine transport system substrate-binding protein
MQTIFTEATGLGPVNKNAKLAPAIAADVVYGPDNVQKLIATDLKVINANRAAWTARWNREIER